jgi:Domain of unknown function (DUF397)
MTSPDLSLAIWRKASHSSGSGNDCVEIAAVADLVAVRDSKNPNGRKMLVSRSAFRRLAEEICDGHHDR